MRSVLQDLFDHQADEDRRRAAAFNRVVRDWEWARPLGGHNGDRLLCPAGELIEATIQGRTQAGPSSVLKKGADGTQADDYTGRGARWRIMGAVADLGRAFLKEVAEAMSLLNPPSVSGDIEGAAWEWLSERMDYGRLFEARQQGVIGLQSMAVRPVLQEYTPGVYYPAGLQEVPPDLCFAIPDPSSPGRPAVFGAYLGEGDATTVTASGGKWTRGGWWIWDMSHPLQPVWGLWDSPDQWKRWQRPSHDDLERLAWMGSDYMGASGPRLALVGAQYPWLWQGRPIMPAVCQQFSPTTRQMLPSQWAHGQAVLDLVFQRIWALYVQHGNSFNRSLIFSDHPLAGFGQMMHSPGSFTNIFGPGSKNHETVAHGMDGVQILWELHDKRVLEWVRKFDPGFEAQATREAESGHALRIRSAARHRLRRKQRDQARTIDTLCLQAVISTHNGLVRGGQMGPAWGAPGLIPEGDIALAYSDSLDAIEEEERLERTRAAVDRGVEYAEREWLLERGFDTATEGSEEWKEATRYVDAALMSNVRRASMGLGMRAQDRMMIAMATPEDETETHIPDADTADAATRGLQMRDETGRGTSAMTANGKRLRSRARALRQREPMTIGEVRALNTWLRQHEADGTQPAEVGEWGNDADPSDAWVDYVSQGGEAGRDWSGMVLATETGGGAVAAPDEGDGDERDEEVADVA